MTAKVDQSASNIRSQLKSVLSNATGWAEARYHAKKSRVLGVRRGEVSEMSSKTYTGVGIRVLLNGAWGFASTSDLSVASLQRTLKSAEEMARELSLKKKQPVTIASSRRLATGEFFLPGFVELDRMPLEEKFRLVRESESKLRGRSQKIESALCNYTEVFEEKVVVTTDGADAHTKLVRPELRFSAFAADGTKRTAGFDSVGVTGGWECLFLNRTADQFIDQAAGQAVDLLKAPPARGGKSKVILSPSIVGLLCHEAIGHTVEADMVNAGSVAKGQIGQPVASSLVNLCDSGASEYREGAGGIVTVDDEGVLTERTYVIKDGKLASYLHNRETASQFGVEPTGNARAWEFSDEPLIRMRNTYIEPGKDSLDSMVAGIDDGYFVDGPEGGQADSTGEFMFGANKVRRIRNGKITDMVQNVTLSGVAFDVLKSVDAISKDFLWDLGSGHCGKGQPAKVDAGGPYVRCEILVGGEK